MKKATVRDLHNRTNAIVKEVLDGETFVIEKRGVAVAEIRPLSERPPTGRLPDREALILRLPSVQSDSGKILEQDRF